MIAVDGTKVQANASPRREPRLRADRARDPRGGRGGRRGRGRALRRGARRRAAAGARDRAGSARVAARGQAPARGRARERGRGRSRASARSALKEAKRRLEEELWTEVRANAAYEAYRARGRMKDGRRFGRAAEALPAAGDAGGPDQPHRPRLARRQGPARLDPGLQRPGRHQRAPDRHRRRGDDRLAGLRAPRADARRRPARARARPASPSTPEVVLADAGYWHQRADGTHRRPRHRGADPARRQPPQGRRGRAGTAASTRSCAACSPPSAAASSTANASR